MRPMRWRNSDMLRPRVAFAGALLAIALVWMVVLPRVAAQPAVRAQIEQNERLGIDPSAKFYTELPAMPQLFERTDSARRREPEAFWSR
ncbi:MAG TPA: hypothetical protein VG713_14940 [Pirellulales bacterium]|nr:hypothetical protein [Pirellulales bacterium]